jgi:acyl-coenzyme A thioesterase PaaI-like protein
MEPTEIRDPIDDEALLALADSVRRLVAQVRATNAPRESLEQARLAVERAEAILEPHLHDGPFAQTSLDGGFGMVGRTKEFARLFPYSPLVGRINPVAPPAEFVARDGVIHGRVRFGAAYCGGRNYVHGGIVAALLDEILGNVNMVNGVGGVTGTLTIRYRNPTPLFEELRVEGRCVRKEGRKVFSEGSLWLGETLLAEAEGIFIQRHDTSHLALASAPFQRG